MPVNDEYFNLTKDLKIKYEQKTPDLTDLLKDYITFAQTNATFIAFLFIVFLADPVISETLADLLAEHLRKTGEEDQIEKYLIMISTPLNKPAVVMEHLEFLALAAEEPEPSERVERLKKHWQKWQWFPCYNPSDEPYALEHYERELDRYTSVRAREELNQINVEHEQHARAYEQFFSSIENPELKKLISITNKICFYREYRNDLRREGLFYISRLYRAIGETFGLSTKEVCYLTNDEIKQSLENGKLVVEKERISDRIKGYVLFGNADFLELVDDSSLVELIKEKIKSKESKADILKGQPASPGVARGPVIIISNINRLKDFKEGSVLVASMTAPDYVPAMKKSVAIVTDEGGITCHAAIVSRELKIPCVVGTKVATKVLKDGDLVEVDAGKGVVRKIS